MHMSYSGPQVPDGLASTLIAAGEPAAKKKRMQRMHGGKAGDKVLAAPPPPLPSSSVPTFLLTRTLTLCLALLLTCS